MRLSKAGLEGEEPKDFAITMTTATKILVAKSG
jgi:hypothetical protein